MKKLISLVCVVAMLFSLAMTVNAAGTAFTLELKEQTATSVTYELYLDTDVNLAAFGICYDMKDAISKGIADADISVTANLANVTARYVANQDLISIKRADTSGSTVTGQAKVVTIVINTTNMTGAFNFTQASGSSAKNFAVTEQTVNGAADITANVTFPTATVAMYAPAFTPETKKADEVAAGATEVELEKVPATAWTNLYTNVAVFKGSFAADSNYSKAGLIWVKDGVETANTFDVADGTKVSGAGTIEYSVAMYAIPDGVTISAIPYFVTAE